MNFFVTLKYLYFLGIPWFSFHACYYFEVDGTLRCLITFGSLAGAFTFYRISKDEREKWKKKWRTRHQNKELEVSTESTPITLDRIANTPIIKIITLDEIKDLRIIKNINIHKLAEDKVSEVFAEKQLIKTYKHYSNPKKIYVFEYNAFFALNNNYVKNKILFDFYERYSNQNFKGIVIFSRDKGDYKRIFSGSGIDKEKKIEEAIIETIHPEDIIFARTAQEDRDFFNDLKAKSKIIILQLMADDDDFIEELYKFLNKMDLEIIGLVTIFSSLSQKLNIQNKLTEEVLIELNLP